MKMIFTFSLLLLLVSALPAQLQIIPLNVDYGAYKGPGEKTYTEVYLSFYQKDIMYAEEDSNFVAHFVHNISILKGDSVISTQSRRYSNSVKPGQPTQSFNQFVDVFAFELEPGKYQMRADIVDEVAQKSGEYLTDLTIPAYKSDFTLSSIELATSIRKAERSSNFSSKNNIEILPNPSSTYNILSPVLYFYFEAYNLALNDNGKTDYSYEYLIKDLDGNTVKNFGKKDRSSNVTTVAEANGMNVISIASAPYLLTVNLTDNISGNTTTISKRFTIYKPSREAQGSGIVGADYDGFTDEQLADEFSKIRYIASEDEKKVFAKLDLAGQRRFFHEFWKKRDDVPETFINEYKVRYFQMINLANEHYSTKFKEGWQTDRGRVLMVYGRPDEIERAPSSIDTQPYETWYYYSLEGGVNFIFGDISGNNNYELLHSTFRSEIQDPDWYSRISKTGRGSSMDGF